MNSENAPQRAVRDGAAEVGALRLLSALLVGLKYRRSDFLGGWPSGTCVGVWAFDNSENMLGYGGGAPGTIWRCRQRPIRWIGTSVVAENELRRR